MQELFVYGQNYKADDFFQTFKERIGAAIGITDAWYNKSYQDYCARMLFEAQKPRMSAQTLDQQYDQAKIVYALEAREAKRHPHDVRPIKLINTNDGEPQLIGMMSGPRNSFATVDRMGQLEFDRYIEWIPRIRGQSLGRMRLIKVYWSDSKYSYNLVKLLVRSQGTGKTSLKKAMTKLDSAIKTKASNLHGWINGKVADWRRDQPFDGDEEDDAEGGAIHF